LLGVACRLLADSGVLTAAAAALIRYHEANPEAPVTDDGMRDSVIAVRAEIAVLSAWITTVTGARVPSPDDTILFYGEWYVGQDADTDAHAHILNHGGAVEGWGATCGITLHPGEHVDPLTFPKERLCPECLRIHAQTGF
jgi:hypothetical protein